MGAISLPRYKELRMATQAGSGLRRKKYGVKDKTHNLFTFGPSPRSSVAPGRKMACSRECETVQRFPGPSGPVSAASVEGRQLQRFHFHLDFKQLYKRASILVTLILFLVGLNGDCIRLSAHRGWKADPCVCVCACVCVCVCVCVTKHFLYI